MLKQCHDSCDEKRSKNNIGLKKHLLLLILPSLFFITFGCKKDEVKTIAEKAINVKVQAAEKKSLRPFIETTGTLNPYEEVVISSEADGILREVKVDEGTLVSKGMALAAVDDTDYILEVQKAESALKQAEATFANTRLEYERKEKIFKEQLVTQQQFDDVSTRLSLTEADADKAKAALALAKQRLSKTRIYSPLAGAVKEKKVSTGDYARNGSNLFVIIQNNPLKLNFTVNEKYAGRLMKGQEVIFKVDAFPDKEFKGKLSIIYPSLEEKTRTLQAEAIAPNPAGMLKPGLFARVKLYTDAEKDTIVIPDISLLYEGETTKVFVVEGDQARERIVISGQKYGKFIEIAEGINEGEQVVVVGQQNLAEGVKVNVAR